MNRHVRNRLRPALDTLEARDVPAVWTVGGLNTLLTPSPAPAPVTQTPPVTYVAAAMTSPVTSSTTQALENGVAAFAAAHMGQRVGGGECVHLATEALRAAGARFAWLGGTTTDYAWGGLVNQVTGYSRGAVSSNAAAPLRPGDIIQYSGAVFRDGTRAWHHTAIVASVDGAGHVTAVYQQNFNGARAVTWQPLDLSQLVAGTVKVYRPLPRTATATRFQFTLVNNTGTSVAVTERAGTGVSSYWLSRTNTTWSYQIRTWVTTGARPTIVVAGKTIAVDDMAAYEIYTGPGGVPAIRKLSV
jgi:hypothetical protein